MSEIGQLTQATPNSLSYLSGFLETLDTKLSIQLEGDETLCDAREPSHRIFTRARSGSMLPIGSAWLKTAKHGPRTGKRFFTLSIDYPGASGPLNVAAFPNGDSGDWVIVWRRRGVQAAA